MRIDLYTISWNERRILPFFLEHYGPWVDRFIVFDDGSDDGTAEALMRHPKVDLRPFPPKVDSFVLTAQALWQDVWKESRGHADWVIVTNVDEFLFHPTGERAYLERCSAAGVTILHPFGYTMVGNVFPPPGSSLVGTVRRGVPMGLHDKRQVFDPNAIEEINFTPGRHFCDPTGTVLEPEVPEASLLHYKYVDLNGYFFPRQRALAARLLEGDRRRQLGWHYDFSEEAERRSFEWLDKHATDVVSMVRGAIPGDAEARLPGERSAPARAT